MAANVKYFESDDAESSEEEEFMEQPFRKRRRLNRVWCERKKYDSAADAKSEVNSEDWKIISSKKPIKWEACGAVSYTHLTLPTIYSV